MEPFHISILKALRTSDCYFTLINLLELIMFHWIDLLPKLVEDICRDAAAIWKKQLNATDENWPVIKSTYLRV